MALTRLNNRSISAVTALPSGISDYALTISDLPVGSIVKTSKFTHTTENVSVTSTSLTTIQTYTVNALYAGSIIRCTHRYRYWWGSTTTGSGDYITRYLVNGNSVHYNARMLRNIDGEHQRDHGNREETFEFIAPSAGNIGIQFQMQCPSNQGNANINVYHASSESNAGQASAMYFIEVKQ
jgi:hypothetical protein